MRENDNDPQFTWASEHHIRLDFGAAPEERTSSHLDRTLAAIEQARVPGLVGVTPAARTLLLEFDLETLDEQRSITTVRKAIAEAAEDSPRQSAAIVEIPVCYDPSYASDLDDVARLHGITPADLIRLHSEASYVVKFIGFVPGFGYLSGLPDRLNTPRLDTPRMRVPTGSVGIAGDQTGVYPGNTAGGWRLIGRTPLRMFDAGQAKPSLLARGDQVRFVPISLAEFNARMRGQPHDE